MNMKITFFTKIKTALCLLGLFAASYAGAAQADIVVEAENADALSNASVETEYSGFSGAKGLSGMRDAKESSAQYFITVSEEGTYDLSIEYSSVEVRYIYVKVNDQIPTGVMFSKLTGTWDGHEGTVEGELLPGIETKTVKVYLEQGENTLELAAFNGWSPNIDKFTLSKSAEAIAKPADITAPRVMEAESANEFNGNFGPDMSSFPQFSGAGGVGGNSANKAYAKFSNLDIAEAGVYELSIYYATMQERYAYTKVNNQGSAIFKFDVYTANWGDKVSDDPVNDPVVRRKTVPVYFEKGKNSLTIGAANGWSPNIDKLSIAKINMDDYVKPEPEAEAFAYSFTQDAQLTEQHVTNGANLSALVDNNEYTFYRIEGQTSTQIVAKLQNPTLIVGYGIGTSIDNPVDNIDSWLVEYSQDGQSWAEMPIAKTANQGFFWTVYANNTPKSENKIVAQYYRLTAKAAKDIEIGEWQLYGVPYVTEQQNFPDDITSLGGYITASDDGFNRGGEYDEVFENSIDKNITTKYTIVGQKTFWLQYEPNDPVTVKSYSLSVPYTTQFGGRNPKNWILTGYDYDINDWVTLDSVSNARFPLDGGTTLTFDVKTPGAYYAYKLEVSANNGSDDVHLLQWQLFETGGSSIENEALEVIDGIKITSSAKAVSIEVENPANQAYTVYSILGQKIASGYCVDNVTTISLSEGLYVVKVGNKVEKVLVK